MKATEDSKKGSDQTSEFFWTKVGQQFALHCETSWLTEGGIKFPDRNAASFSIAYYE